MERKVSTQRPRKHCIPERSCITCRGKKAKGELIRLVYSAGAITIDPKRKQSGRGAYLCPVRECWEAGLRNNRLDYALRAKLDEKNRKVLVEFANGLPRRQENSTG